MSVSLFQCRRLRSCALPVLVRACMYALMYSYVHFRGVFAFTRKCISSGGVVPPYTLVCLAFMHMKCGTTSGQFPSF